MPSVTPEPLPLDAKALADAWREHLLAVESQSLDDLARTGSSEVLFIRQPKATGAWELLDPLEERGLAEGFVTARVTVLADQAFDSFDGLVRALARNLTAPDTTGKKRGLIALLDRFASKHDTPQSALAAFDKGALALHASGDLMDLSRAYLDAKRKPTHEARRIEAWLSGTELSRAEDEASAFAALSPRTARTRARRAHPPRARARMARDPRDLRGRRGAHEAPSRSTRGRVHGAARAHRQRRRRTRPRLDAVGDLRCADALRRTTRPQHARAPRHAHRGGERGSFDAASAAQAHPRCSSPRRMGAPCPGAEPRAALCVRVAPSVAYVDPRGPGAAVGGARGHDERRPREDRRDDHLALRLRRDGELGLRAPHGRLRNGQVAPPHAPHGARARRQAPRVSPLARAPRHGPRQPPAAPASTARTRRATAPRKARSTRSTRRVDALSEAAQAARGGAARARCGGR